MFEMLIEWLGGIASIPSFADYIIVSRAINNRLPSPFQSSFQPLSPPLSPSTLPIFADTTKEKEQFGRNLPHLK
tara:strand:- start:94 stop:315 length:222 start_codon:yes stop_codon:yes gene_type:complete